MFLPKAIFCRLFQTGFRMVYPILPYREPEIKNSCAEIKDIIKKENLSSVLIVTDKGILANNILNPVTEALDKNNVSYIIFSETLPNPTVTNVEEALALYYKHRCNGIIAIGGGSSIDCAKAVGARVVYPKRSVNKMGGKLKLWRKLPPLVAIPTTAGTGSETTLAALITDTETEFKYAIMSFPLIPRYAILDPELTYSLPPHLTASTGVDALTHAIEAFIGQSTTKETRQLAHDAVKLVFENINIAYSDGKNFQARKNMLLAAYKAGNAFSKSYVGYIHAIAHSLGGKYGAPHGLSNAVIMPYILEAYGSKIYKKLYTLGITAGVLNGNEKLEDGAKKFIEELKKLNISLGIPNKLTGIKKEDIREMAAHAEKESNPLYPVPVLFTRKELEQFYHMIADWSK